MSEPRTPPDRGRLLPREVKAPAWIGIPHVDGGIRRVVRVVPLAGGELWALIAASGAVWIVSDECPLPLYDDRTAFRATFAAIK